MGAWGHGAFENDSVLDWFNDLVGVGPSLLRRTLMQVANYGADDYLDVDDGSAAIGAAEIIASALGAGGNDLPPSVKTWLVSNRGAIGDGDRMLARQAIERVVASQSELVGLWSDGGEPEWHDSTRSLFARLGGDADSLTFSTDDDEAAGLSQQHAKQGLLTFMQARGLVPNEKQLARIEASQDADQLRRWLGRVITARSVDAVLDD